MIRTQFPVKLAFSITSNKSQGQTLKHVGIYLEQDFFSHGQVSISTSSHGTFKLLSDAKMFLLLIYTKFFSTVLLAPKMAEGTQTFYLQKDLCQTLLYVCFFCFSYMSHYPEFRGHKTLKSLSLLQLQHAK